jgi:phosphatidylcholine synthase
MRAPPEGRAGRVTAWAVHAYTALGAVLGIAMIHFAFERETATVLWLFLIAMVIDGTDGFLARWARVSERVPQIDGALLDNIVDYLTYALAPMAFLYAGGYVPDGAEGFAVVAVPLLASCYQFCRSDAKTADHFFRGFPSYWNVVAFYVVVLGLGPTAVSVLLLALSVLAFVPIRCLYPSRTASLWPVTMTLTTLWLVLYAVIVAQLPTPAAWAVVLSLAYVAYYTVASVALTLRGRRSAPESAHPVEPLAGRVPSARV